MNDEIKNYLVSQRKINEVILKYLESNNLIRFENETLILLMKDLYGNIIGAKQRFIKGFPKSKSMHDSRNGYFYIEIDFNQPIIIVEGEIDWLTLLPFCTTNIIGLSSITMLGNIIDEILHINNISTIGLFVDNDNPASEKIKSVLEKHPTAKIIDGRMFLGTYKDINDLIMNGEKFDYYSLIDYIKEQAEKIDYKNRLIIGKRSVLNVKSIADIIIEKNNLISVNKKYFRYSNENNDNQGIWVNIEEGEVKNLVVDFMINELQLNNPKVNDKNGIMSYIEHLSLNKQLYSKLNNHDENEINLNDGIYNIKIGDFRRYTKEDYKFSKLRYGYDLLKNNIKPPISKWLLFLDQIFTGYREKEKIIELIQEYLGLCFTSNTQFEKGLLFYGTGANGKGTLLYVIQNLFGENGYCSLPLNEINKEQNLMLLLGKYVAIDEDMQQGVQLDGANIKIIISGENVLAKEVYVKPINFKPFAKIIVATNELPYIKTIDNSTKRRRIFINLKQNFYGKENYNLKKELLGEIDGIFYRAIEGLKRLNDRGYFDIPEELVQELSNFVIENDSVEQFLQSGAVEIGDELFIPLSVLYRSYSGFCKENGYKALMNRRFKDRLLGKGNFQEKNKNGRIRGIIGLGTNEKRYEDSNDKEEAF